VFSPNYVTKVSPRVECNVAVSVNPDPVRLDRHHLGGSGFASRSCRSGSGFEIESDLFDIRICINLANL
jgi:hypothetical protein